MDGKWHVIVHVLWRLSDQTAALRDLAAAPDVAEGRELRCLATERCLEIAAICCLDAGNHVIARLGLPRAESYSDIGAVLRSSGVISEDTKQFMRELADVRQRLMHVYWRITPEDVQETIPRLIPQFERFAQEIQQFLETRG